MISRQIFLLFLIFFLNFTVNAQFNEVNINMSKGLQSGLKIKWPNLNKETAFQGVTEVLSDKNSALVPVFNSEEEIFFTNLSLPLVSSLKCSLYGIFLNQDSSFVICVATEEKMINSNNSLKEMIGVQSLCLEIKKQIEKIIKIQNIDSLKYKISQLEVQYQKVSDDIDKLKRVVKIDNKDAAKDEKSAIKTNEQSKLTVSEIEQTKQSIAIQQKEINEFPINQLENENKFKNSNISSNRKMIKKLGKSNRKLTNKIIDVRTEIEVNKQLITNSKDNVKELKKLNKSQLKYESKINKYQSQIDFNKQNIQLKRVEINNDSIVVRRNEKKMDDFDIKGRQREVNKLISKQQDLENKNQKQKTKIETSTAEAELKRKEAEVAQAQSNALVTKQLKLKEDLELLKSELRLLER
jgi:exonuclease SbcC